MMNEIRIMGFLGRPPVFKDGGNGKREARFNVATYENVTEGKTKRKVTEWHHVVIRNPYLMDVLERLNKGKLVYVTGKKQTRKYLGEDRIERVVSEIVLGHYHGKLLLVEKKGSPERISVPEGILETEPDNPPDGEEHS